MTKPQLMPDWPTFSSKAPPSKGPTALSNTPTSWEQNVKHSSQWVTFHIQTTELPIAKQHLYIEFNHS